MKAGNWSKNRITGWMESLPLVSRIVGLSQKITLPGFRGLSLYDVAVSFIRGLTEGYITSRAAAISYSVFLAIFPFLIFLFTIIPFVPVRDFQLHLLGLIREFMPSLAYESVKDTIVDIITRPRSSLLLLNLLLTLYFSTNGVNSLIEAFNNTYHVMESRSKVRQYAVSLGIVLINSLLLIIAIGLMTLGPRLLQFFMPAFIRESVVMVFLLDVTRWMIILALLFTAISLVYYLAPARRKIFRFISPGSMLATFLIIVTTLGFNFYVDNFSTYNALYGSLGTLMIVLLWIYLNAISLLVGFELNASISSTQGSHSPVRPPARKTPARSKRELTHGTSSRR
mgnify:CR=1 FL=1